MTSIKKLLDRVSLPVKFFLVTVFSIFISGLFVNTIPGLHSDTLNFRKFIEAFLITFCLIPELYLFLYRPLKQHLNARANAEAELKSLNQDLELLVRERTNELNELNKLLKEEYIESLRLSEEKYKNVIDSLGVGITLIGPNLEVLSINDHVKKFFPQIDFSKNPICYQTFVDPPRDSPCIGCPVKRTFDDGSIHKSVLNINRGLDTRINKVISSPLKDKNGTVIAAVKVVEDVTERVQAENALRSMNQTLEKRIKERTIKLESINQALINSEERYRSLIRQSSEGVIIFNPGTRVIQEANNQICDMLGYEEQEIVGQKLEKIVASDVHILQSNIKKMILTGEKISGLRLYRHKDGSLVEVEVYASLIKYGNGKVVLTNIRNVTERRKAEEALKESFSNLKLTLKETVNALVTMAEKRDPYTAGHQFRVAKLAGSIAREMGLPEAQIEGIIVAGKLHDIGKIYVPIDILNKPGRLTDMEMGIIKSHTQIGYEILEKIPFEYPVANTVVQHHEKLDGSGYPFGLRGEEILLEAKIICVADVVEAMASHRPYRPTLGVHKALEEIIKNKGVFYEPDVVDACLSVFNSKEFNLDNALKDLA